METVKIAAVGDILMWGRQIEAAKQEEDHYSFDYMFEEVAPFLKGADVTIGNLETTLSGREMNYQQKNPVRNWPMFNCPDELAETLKKAGFTVLTTANNHCLDRGPEGLKRTLDILDKEKILHTGTCRSAEESKQELIIDVKGIKIGILSFTYGTNLIPIPKDEPWVVNLIRNEMLKKIYKLKKVVDLTIVCLHFGREFRLYPSTKQRKWAQQCFEHGADIILGAHPHVIQPMKSLRIKDIDGLIKKRFIIYSLGNFTSRRMRKRNDTISGLILNLWITKNQGETRITNIEYIPTWVNQRDQFKVLPVSSYLKNDQGNLLKQEEQVLLNKAWIDTTTHLGGTAR